MADESSPKTAGAVSLSEESRERSVQLPLYQGSLGPNVIDIRKLYQETGYFTFDPGFTSTASCESKITYIDGDKGELFYRGYPIEELAEQAGFLEVCYLLLYGELPNAAAKAEFERTITIHTMLNEQILTFYQGFRRDAHPMAVMCGVVGAMSAFYHDSTDIEDPEQRVIASHRLVAKVPTIAAMAYKYSVGQPFVYPRNDLGFVENFLHMMFAVPCETYRASPAQVRAMERIFILHADHEQNASTSTVRTAGSSGANPFACIAAGIASLWGPAHGGANEAVLKMLAEIGTKARIPEFIKRAKDKADPFKLMGFGHRVYKNYDPRAAVLRASCHEVLEELGVAHEPLLEIASELERIALEDEYFIERKLFPNVDFYSGIILRAMGLPTGMFTVLFAVARTVRLDSAVERDDRGPDTEDQPAAACTTMPKRSCDSSPIPRVPFDNNQAERDTYAETETEGLRRLSHPRRRGHFLYHPLLHYLTTLRKQSRDLFESLVLTLKGEPPEPILWLKALNSYPLTL